MIVTKGLFEQHFHGCFGIYFNTASVDEIILLSKKMFQRGITTIIPTLGTDTLENLQKQILNIAKAQEQAGEDCAKIFGIHLEGPFLNEQKKGAHPEKLLKKPNVDDYKKYLDHPIIKIVTLAPELDENLSLCDYLLSKNVKVSAGHCLDYELKKVNQVTHLFNAMEGLHHREKSTSMTALTKDLIYTEIIADGEHVQDDMLKLLFKTKSKDKILLISDTAPSAKSDIKEFEFLGEMIYLQGDKLVGKDGTIAGSAMLLDDIVKRLVKNHLLSFDDVIKMASLNQREYHNFDDNCIVEWDDNLNVKKVQKLSTSTHIR